MVMIRPTPPHLWKGANNQSMHACICCLLLKKKPSSPFHVPSYPTQPSSVMGRSSISSFLSLFLIISTAALSLLSSFASQHPLLHHLLLDHLMRDYAFRCYTHHPKTAFVYSIPLPPDITGIRAHTVRYRSGSFRRYGAQIQQFRLPPGANVRPYVQRLVLVQQHWGNWSSVYYNSTNNASDYRLVSPVIGFFAYDGDDLNSDNPTQIDILMEKPMTVDFSEDNPRSRNSSLPLCAYFGKDGGISVYNQTIRSSSSSSPICIGFGPGHYGLVVKAPARPVRTDGGAGDGDSAKISKWKVVVGSSVGGFLVAVLLGLLCVALVQSKKRSKLMEMERRAYEEEALEVSMVGHFRAPTAARTRTLPSLENDYTP